MVLRPNNKQSRLFTVRVWVEELDGGHAEWRGKVQLVPSGETLYFRDWEAMEAFLMSSLEEVPGSGLKVPGRESRGSLGVREGELL
jgi:hypothetical protein